MSDTAIRVEGLSKAYRIGLKEQQHETMLGAVSAWIKSPFENFRNLRNLSRFDGAKSEDSRSKIVDGVGAEDRRSKIEERVALEVGRSKIEDGAPISQLPSSGELSQSSNSKPPSS